MLHSSKNIQKGSEEFVIFQTKIQHYIQWHNEELGRIKPIITKLRQKFAKKWMETESEEYREMADFGECVEAGILSMMQRTSKKLISEAVRLSATSQTGEQKSAEEIKKDKMCGLFFDTEKEWQLYCEYFKKMYEKMLKKKVKHFGKSIMSCVRLRLRKERRLIS